MKLSNREEKRLTKQGHDLPFKKVTQPKGHIDFHRNGRYWLSGDGYHSSLYVTSYPAYGLGYYWLRNLMEVDQAISVLTLKHGDSSKTKAQADKAVEEKLTRLTPNTKTSKRQQEMSEIEVLGKLSQNIGRYKASVKEGWIRNYYSADTQEELFIKEKEIKERVPNYQMTSFIDEQEFEYHAPFIPGSKQHLIPNAREGQVMPVRDLAGGYWFNHTKLADSRGTYFGYTSTDGAVNYNFLQQDDKRTRPFMMITGNPKMGQRKFLLKHTDSMFFRGHKIINIDISGIFKEQTLRQGGKIVDASGETNRINPMQTFPTVTKENGIDIDEEASFRKQVSKLKTLAQITNTDIDGDDLIELEKQILDFYEGHGFFYSNAESIGKVNNITKLVNEEHPMLSDFSIHLRRKERNTSSRGKEQSKNTQNSLTRLANTFESLVLHHKDKFDVVTEFEDLSKEQVITFDFSNLISDEKMLNTQLAQYLTLISSYVVNNGKVQKARQKEENLEIDQYTHYIINISGADKMFNPSFAHSVKFLAELIESMSDNFGGVVMEMSNIQSILVASDTRSLDPYVLAIRQIFSLTQHRVFANVSETTIKLFAATLSDSMTESELETLSTLNKGQLFLNISGAGNVIFNLQLLGNDTERYQMVD